MAVGAQDLQVIPLLACKQPLFPYPLDEPASKKSRHCLAFLAAIVVLVVNLKVFWVLDAATTTLPSIQPYDL